jgi:hypothetical protein
MIGRMAQTYEAITPPLREFIEKQKVFFVATAPAGDGGHVNLSPKGLDAFRVLTERRVAYLDLTGSGNETSAHLEDNGRITFMFCALDGKPLIVRLYGRGRTVLPTDPAWEELARGFDVDRPGVRQIIVADLDRVGTSCGFGVPLYEYQRERADLVRYAEKKGTDGMGEYRRKKNVRSIDGLVTTLGKVIEPAS